MAGNEDEDQDDEDEDAGTDRDQRERLGFFLELNVDVLRDGGRVSRAVPLGPIVDLRSRGRRVQDDRFGVCRHGQGGRGGRRGARVGRRGRRIDPARDRRRAQLGGDFGRRLLEAGVLEGEDVLADHDAVARPEEHLVDLPVVDARAVAAFQVDELVAVLDLVDREVAAGGLLVVDDDLVLGSAAGDRTGLREVQGPRGTTVADDEPCHVVHLCKAPF